MKKPNSLRQHLVSGLKYLQDNPEQLSMFIENGHYRCTMATGYSMESVCPVKFAIYGFSGDPDLIAFLLFQWIRVNQSDLMANLEKNKTAVKFEAEMLDNGKTDVLFELELTERIIVKKQGTTFNFDYPVEPQYTAVLPATTCELLDDNGTLLATWLSPDVEDSVALEMPFPTK